MTAVEFVIRMKGFVKAANNFTLTPKQWDDLKDKLSDVDIVDPKIKGTRYELDATNWVTTNNTARINDVTYKQGESETKTLLTDNKIY